MRIPKCIPNVHQRYIFFKFFPIHIPSSDLQQKKYQTILELIEHDFENYVVVVVGGWRGGGSFVLSNKYKFGTKIVFIERQNDFEASK